MKDETWGQIAWWVATIFKWTVLAALALLALLLVAFAAGMHGCPF